MGQYFKAVLLGPKEGTKENIIGALAPMDYQNLNKLMEHSYEHNHFVNAVMNTIGKKFKNGVRLVWAGDYAKNEQYRKKNLYMIVYDMEEKGEDIFIKKASMKNPDYRFLLNESKGEVVDLWDLPSFNGWTVHPLPLLTVEGNEEGGGGTYRGLNQKMVGTWARDIIRVQKQDWKKVRRVGDTGLAIDFGRKGHLITKYYKLIKPNFAESYEIASSFYKSIEGIQQALNEGLIDISDIREGLAARGLNKGIVRSIQSQKPEIAKSKA